MTPTEEHALGLHQSGLNCAQSVLTTYAPVLGFDAALASDISLGFGSGMGRLQKTCGAVTGAFMALGIWNARQSPADAKEAKEKAYASVQEFNRKFVEIHGSTQCHTLLGCDMNTEQGRLFYKTNNLSSTVCDQCILHAVQIVDEMIR